jgi:hypothetical protein
MSTEWDDRHNLAVVTNATTAVLPAVHLAVVVWQLQQPLWLSRFPAPAGDAPDGAAGGAADGAAEQLSSGACRKRNREATAESNSQRQRPEGGAAGGAFPITYRQFSEQALRQMHEAYEDSVERMCEESSEDPSEEKRAGGQ